MKKTRVVVAALTFCVLALVYAASLYAQTDADFEVTLTDDGEGVIITKYVGKAAQVRIPATIQGMPVKQIGGGGERDGFFDAFQNTSVTGVIIPAGVTAIEQSAFAWTRKLTSIVIPEGVTKIGPWAFSESGITSIQLPSSLVKIGDDYQGRVFSGSNLTSITLPPGITSIPEEAFSRCEKLQTVTMPGVRTIGRGAFSGCKALTAINFSDNIRRIGDWAFGECAALTTVTIPDSVQTIEFTRYEGGGAFSGCSKLNLASQAAIKKRGYEDGFNSPY